jgi:hypothetical protein
MRIYNIINILKEKRAILTNHTLQYQNKMKAELLFKLQGHQPFQYVGVVHCAVG